MVKKHIRDEEIKLMMFSDILQKEVANQQNKSRQIDQKRRSKNLLSFLDSGRSNNDAKDLIRYKSMMQESEEIFKKEMEEKITLSLFAGDKFFKMQKAHAPKKTPEIDEEKKLDPNN